MKEDKIRESVIEAGHRLLKNGLTARTWGNISARLNDDSMIITPSGRDYESMKPEELVKVRISDLTYSGSIKPSVEKSFHAGIYRLHPEADFIIHTHQLYASAVSIIGMDEVSVSEEKYPLLGHRLVIAGYGIPGSKKLSRNVLKAAGDSSGKAMLLKAHGAVCFGQDIDEAFEASVQLEDACREIIDERYSLLSGRKNIDLYEMTSYSMSKFLGLDEKKDGRENKYLCSSERTKDGIVFADRDGNVVKEEGSENNEIHSAIYEKYPNINSIFFSDSPTVKAVAAYGITLKPLLDDFAQMDGTKVKTVPRDKEKIVSALKSSSVVFIKDEGALCIGSTRSDAEAAGIILDKACICFAGAALFDNVQYLNPLECFAMRSVYINKYSKEKNKS